MAYKCPRCGSKQNDDPGLCYNCRCKDFQKGKCSAGGYYYKTEIDKERLSELLEIERKHKK